MSYYRGRSWLNIEREQVILCINSAGFADFLKALVFAPPVYHRGKKVWELSSCLLLSGNFGWYVCVMSCFTFQLFGSLHWPRWDCVKLHSSTKHLLVLIRNAFSDLLAFLCPSLLPDSFELSFFTKPKISQSLWVFLTSSHLKIQ